MSIASTKKAGPANEDTLATCEECHSGNFEILLGVLSVE
jgi:hypothetical protein